MFGYDKEIVYEMGISNPDKGDLEKQQILDRIKVFQQKGLNVRINRQFLLFDINRDFRNSHICIGYDTIVRIFMKKYYENGVDDIYKGFRNIEEQNNQLVIFGRQTD